MSIHPHILEFITRQQVTIWISQFLIEFDKVNENFQQNSVSKINRCIFSENVRFDPTKNDKTHSKCECCRSDKANELIYKCSDGLASAEKKKRRCSTEKEMKNQRT